MAFHVMDSEQRNPARERQRLTITHANEQCANQSRSIRNSNGIEIIELRSRFFDGALDHRHDAGEMRARCNLRNDSAEDAMHVLRQDDQRFLDDVVAFPLEDGRRGLVARGLDPEYARHDYSVRSVSNLSTNARASGEFQSVADMSFFLITPSLPMMNVSG